MLLGSSTGRDGIGGVSVLASAGFGGGDAEAEAAKRPSVQVGDPYEEKRLIEACLELLDAELVVGIQDLGGAGLVCATSETAARGGVGMDVDVSAVPRREPGMAAYEVMTSESQERMLAIVTPEDLARVRGGLPPLGGAFGRGRAGSPSLPPGSPGGCASSTASTARCWATCPPSPCSEDAPLYHRPLARPGRPRRPAGRRPRLASPPRTTAGADLLALLADPSWVYRQYDHQLFLNTVDGPRWGRRRAPAGRPRPARPRARGLALTTDSNPTWCAIDPRAGTAATVAEAALNVACAGARPDGRGQLPQLRQSRAPRGHVAAVGVHRRHEPRPASALGLPVIGGNVSLYNESYGVDIDPTPVIGVLGLIDRLAARPPGVTLVDGAALVLLDAGVGTPAPTGARRRWPARGGPSSCRGHRDGTLPALDLAGHRPAGRVVADLVAEWRWPAGRPAIRWCRESTTSPAAGSGVALAEMAVRSGVGCQRGRGGRPPRAVHRGAVPGGGLHHPPGRVVARAAEAGVGFRVLGTAGGDRVVVEGLVDVGVAEATAAWRGPAPPRCSTSWPRSPTRRRGPGGRSTRRTGRWPLAGRSGRRRGLELVEHPVGHLEVARPVPTRGRA